MQLRILLLGLVMISAGPALAEQMPANDSGEIYVRGNYWRDRNTRVWNPTVQIQRQVGRVEVRGHYLLDAITSASVGTGAAADEPFTELRHEAGLQTAVRLTRQVGLRASYSYSTESDYWSHNAGLLLQLSLLKDNTTLLFGGDYTYNLAGRRLGPTGYLVQGRLNVWHVPLILTQVLSRTLLCTASYELTVSDGYHNNPYRPVFVGNDRREMEKLPTRRYRHAMAVSLHGLVPFGSSVVPHLTLRPGLRVFADSWGLKALAPEMTTYLPIGPVELRLLFAYYRQWQVDFYRSEGDSRMKPFPEIPTPAYAGGPVEWSGQQVYTSDAKLGTYNTGTAELMLRWRLSVLSGLPHIGDILSRSMVELGGGLWIADAAVGHQFNIPLARREEESEAACLRSCVAYYVNLGFLFPL
jgi:hypothetical protein